MIAKAEAWLAAGEPQQAIATLTPEPELAPAEARLILARSLLRLGDLPAAEMMVARIPIRPCHRHDPCYSGPALAARCSVGRRTGNFRRAELLVDRALRVATREQLRMTVAMAGDWLRSIAVRDSGLSARHSAFLASVPEPTINAVDHRLVNPGAYDPLFVAPLTMRETDVLKRLGRVLLQRRDRRGPRFVAEHSQDAYAVTVPEVIGHPAGGCRPPGSHTWTLLAGARDDQASAAALSWSNSVWLIVPWSSRPLAVAIWSAGLPRPATC